MLDINDIKKYYNDKRALNLRHIFREYLQYKILEVLFNSSIKNKISFLGGTAIRIVHKSNRFSEDLDFDNFDLSFEEFLKTSEDIKKGLELEGFLVEISNVRKEAYHCNIKFPEILYKNNITPIKSEKILIQVDTLSQGFKYERDNFFLNKFDVIKNIQVTPIDILLSQKLYAAFNRKRLKGRDFFDIIYLLPLTKPNYDFLEYRLGVSNRDDLMEYLLNQSKNVDFDSLVHDVQPFLMNKRDSERIYYFIELIKQSI